MDVINHAYPYPHADSVKVVPVEMDNFPKWWIFIYWLLFISVDLGDFLCNSLTRADRSN